jgi:hypothetical protein
METSADQQQCVLNMLCAGFKAEFIDEFEWSDEIKSFCGYLFATFVINTLKLNLICDVPGYKPDTNSCVGRVDDVDDLIELLNDRFLDSADLG